MMAPFPEVAGSSSGAQRVYNIERRTEIQSRFFYAMDFQTQIQSRIQSLETFRPLLSFWMDTIYREVRKFP